MNVVCIGVMALSGIIRRCDILYLLEEEANGDCVQETSCDLYRIRMYIV